VKQVPARSASVGQAFAWLKRAFSHFSSFQVCKAQLKRRPWLGKGGHVFEYDGNFKCIGEAWVRLNMQAVVSDLTQRMSTVEITADLMTQHGVNTL
jgi:hypothetical protein